MVGRRGVRRMRGVKAAEVCHWPLFAGADDTVINASSILFDGLVGGQKACMDTCANDSRCQGVYFDPAALTCLVSLAFPAGLLGEAAEGSG